jgi:hypothetical protein
MPLVPRECQWRALAIGRQACANSVDPTGRIGFAGMVTHRSTGAA